MWVCGVLIEFAIINLILICNCISEIFKHLKPGFQSSLEQNEKKEVILHS